MATLQEDVRYLKSRRNLATRLHAIADQLAIIGANDMGDLTEAEAGNFHNMCDNLDELLTALE